jgi:hypothetical protein
LTFRFAYAADHTPPQKTQETGECHSSDSLRNSTNSNWNQTDYFLSLIVQNQLSFLTVYHLSKRGGGGGITKANQSAWDALFRFLNITSLRALGSGQRVSTTNTEGKVIFGCFYNVHSHIHTHLPSHPKVFPPLFSFHTHTEPSTDKLGFFLGRLQPSFWSLIFVSGNILFVVGSFCGLAACV